MASTGGRGGILRPTPPHSPNLREPAELVRSRHRGVGGGGGWRRLAATAQPAATSCGQAQKASSPPASASSHPLAVAWPPRVWAARTEPGAPGSRALDAVGVCARHAWHWHGAAGAHCGAAGAMHRVNGRGVRQAHRSRRAVRAAPAPSTLLVAARRPPAGWLGHHLPAGQERALTWQVAAWISSEWAARGARCEGRRRTCSGRGPCAVRTTQPAARRWDGGTRWDAVGRWDARGVRFSRARGGG